ncbi:MAG TPA: hypothetical protein VJT75_16680 [Thermoleophilaceae bacterium]|nr:hypothetical protein [Thermoleophilaceae bacterium]
MSPDSRVARPARRATVIGRWGDDTALLRTPDGVTVEVPVPEDLRDAIDVGASVRLLEEGLVDWDAARNERPTG